MIKLLIKQMLFTLLSLSFLTGCENPLGSIESLDPNLGLKEIDNATSLVPVCSADQEASPTFLASQGSGTADDPYLICNAFQLQLMGNVDFEENAHVLAGNENLDAYFELGADIDATITSSWNNGDGFVPIGSRGIDYYGIGTDAGFSGSFHGNDYTINGLFIDRSRFGLGMFGVIAPFAVVTNLRITNIDVQSTGSGVGAIAGYLYSNLKNIYVQGSVDGDSFVGGVAGATYDAVLRNVHANISASGADFGIGGMIGYSNESLIIHSSLEGVVTGNNNVGGMMGFSMNDGLTNIAFSSVNADVSGNQIIGGLIGYGANGNLSVHSSFSGDM